MLDSSRGLFADTLVLVFFEVIDDGEGPVVRAVGEAADDEELFLLGLGQVRKLSPEVLLFVEEAFAFGGEGGMGGGECLSAEEGFVLLGDEFEEVREHGVVGPISDRCDAGEAIFFYVRLECVEGDFVCLFTTRGSEEPEVGVADFAARGGVVEVEDGVAEKSF